MREPQTDRQPLLRPQAPNEVWSVDFVFDRPAEGRVLKCLTIVGPPIGRPHVGQLSTGGPAKSWPVCPRPGRSRAKDHAAVNTLTLRSDRLFFSSSNPKSRS